MAGAQTIKAPKQGARFHFSLPGSTQGFMVKASATACADTRVENIAFEGGRALALRYSALADGLTAVATTPTFTPPDVTKMRTYDLMASPSIYPGQTLSARLAADQGNQGAVTVSLAIGVYNSSDGIDLIETDPVTVTPGSVDTLEWRVPDTGGQPIAEIGLIVRAAERRADGRVIIDWMTWSGVPQMVLKRPQGDGDFWWRAWVSDCQFFSKRFKQSFRMSHGRGTGVILQGARDWDDYQIDTEIMIHTGEKAGLVVRAQGRRRYYAAVLNRNGEMSVVRQFDDETTTLASVPAAFAFETPIPVTLAVSGDTIRVAMGGETIKVRDDSDQALRFGAMGLLVTEGAVSAETIKIAPSA